MSQTPQVALDHQVYEQGRKAVLELGRGRGPFPSGADRRHVRGLLRLCAQARAGRDGVERDQRQPRSAGANCPAGSDERHRCSGTGRPVAHAIPRAGARAAATDGGGDRRFAPQLPGCAPARPAVGAAVAPDGCAGEPPGGGRDGEGLGAGGGRARRPGGRRSLSAGGSRSAAGAPLVAAAARRGEHRADPVVARATARVAGGHAVLVGGPGQRGGR